MACDSVAKKSSTPTPHSVKNPSFFADLQHETNCSLPSLAICNPQQQAGRQQGHPHPKWNFVNATGCGLRVSQMPSRCIGWAKTGIELWVRSQPAVPVSKLEEATQPRSCAYFLAKDQLQRLPWVIDVYIYSWGPELGSQRFIRLVECSARWRSQFDGWLLGFMGLSLEFKLKESKFRRYIK